MGHEWGWGIMGIGWFFWIVLFIVVVWLVVRFAGYTRDGRSSAPPAETPMEILKRRYANGEISKEQYDQMKKDLES